MTAPQRVRVLLADDNEVLRIGLSSLLSSHGSIEVVAEAGDGSEAVRLAALHRPDVAVLDVRMPLMDGVSAAARMPEGTRVLMLTYSDEPDVISTAMRSGALGYLVHGSHTPDEIVRAVVSAANGTAVLGPAAAAVLLRQVAGATAGTAPAGGAAPMAPAVRSGSRFGLTAREEEVMDLVAEGLGNADIAARCFLAEKTVKNHINRIFAKLGVRTRAEAITLWFRTAAAAETSARRESGPGPRSGS
jgi:DNA-binding NarL/FixJ family response regulator